MLTVIGRASSINVRKVLWTCAEIGLSVRREGAGPDLPTLTHVTAYRQRLMTRAGFLA